MPAPSGAGKLDRNKPAHPIQADIIGPVQTIPQQDRRETKPAGEVRSRSPRIRGLIALLLALAVVFPGAVRADESLTYLETAGRFADLRVDAERRLARGDKADTTLLAYLCIAYGKLKEYEKLFDCTAKLEAGIRRGDTGFALDQRVMFVAASDPRPLPDVLRARAYYELGEYGKALSAGSKVLDLLSRLPETGGTSLYPTARYRMSVLEVLAISALRSGDRPQADRNAGALKDVSRPFIGMRMWGWIKDNALSQVYMAMGRYNDALEHIPETSSATKLMVSFVNGLGPYAYRGDSTTAVIEMPRLVMRGKALAETGKLGEAKAVFDEVLASPRIRDTGDLYWVALFERGRIAAAEKQADQAAALYRRAVDIVELQRSTINTESSKIGFAGDKQELYASLVRLLVAQGRAAEAFDYVERSKSRALVDMLSGKRNFSVQAQDTQKSRLILEQLDSADLSMPLDAPGSAAAPPGMQASSGTRNLQLARSELQTGAPDLASVVTVGAVPSEQLKALIGDDEALVEFYYRGQDAYAFVLDRTRLLAIRLEAAGLDDEVRRLRDAIEQPESGAWQAPARALYERLWAPLESALIAAARLTVVAHGALHYLPFVALQARDGSFLGERHGLRFLPSASVLKLLKPAVQGGPASLLVMGNPDLGDPKLDLRFAGEEAQALGGLFPQARVLLRGNASESNFRKAAGGYARIHLATHGSFNAANPLDSGLYLAKDADNDGKLTVGELYSMSLDADLVTLSACETGLGKIASGDDVVGLTRGFLYAGSRSIVASLWSVDDRATGELMKAFYANLATMNKVDALRRAQTTTRESFAHPYFWAAFQLTGRAD